MMMMMNCYCGNKDRCQRSSPSRISDTRRAGCEIFSITQINRVKQRAFGIIYNNNNYLSFEGPLRKGTSVSIPLKNISMSGKELYKVENNLSTHLMPDISNCRNIDYNRLTHSAFK